MLLLAALPVLLLCAVLIKLSSRGPVFYVQARVGKGGEIFNMYKLRTMRSDAEIDTGAVWAAKDDPRIIPGCRWMRHSHVDELPQLINVIKGQMSLVGPRPERPGILAELEKVYPDVRRRLSPGCRRCGTATTRAWAVSAGSWRRTWSTSRSGAGARNSASSWRRCPGCRISRRIDARNMGWFAQLTARQV
jgi:hypothetical protein